uniref:Uncharacterized protein n=1 Tax=Rhizophora mucronata TaxID=61149 RepID=A0A2P2PEH9_RHIMU
MHSEVPSADIKNELKQIDVALPDEFNLSTN